MSQPQRFQQKSGRPMGTPRSSLAGQSPDPQPYLRRSGQSQAGPSDLDPNHHNNRASGDTDFPQHTQAPPPPRLPSYNAAYPRPSYTDAGESAAFSQHPYTGGYDARDQEQAYQTYQPYPAPYTLPPSMPQRDGSEQHRYAYLEAQAAARRRDSMPEGWHSYHQPTPGQGQNTTGNMTGSAAQPRPLSNVPAKQDESAAFARTARASVPQTAVPASPLRPSYPTSYHQPWLPPAAAAGPNRQQQPAQTARPWEAEPQGRSRTGQLSRVDENAPSSAVSSITSGNWAAAPRGQTLSDTGGSRPSTGGLSVNRDAGLGGHIGVGVGVGLGAGTGVGDGTSTRPESSALSPVKSDIVSKRLTKQKQAASPQDDQDNDGDDDEADGEEKMDHRKRKRNRTIRSCVPCHNHKRKCDRKRPCGRCTALGLTGSCVYEVDETRDQHDPAVAEEERLRRRVAELEQVVRELRQRQPSRAVVPSTPALTGSRHGTPVPPGTATSTMAGSDGEGEKSGMDKRRVIVDRYARFKIDEAANAQVAAAAASGLGMSGGSDLLDMDQEDEIRRPGGLPMTRQKRSASDGDKIRIKVQAPGKTYLDEPYKTHLLPGEEFVYDRTGRKTFLGAPAGKSMLRKLRELMSTQRPGTLGETTTNVTASPDSDLLTVPEELAFTGWFPDMRKTFPFTTIWSHENFSGEIIGLLPNKQQSELLLDSWRDEVCAFFVAWHTPSLEAEYRRFFSMTMTEKMSVPLSSLSIYLMICSLGCVMRASKSEIFGHPNREVAVEAAKRGVMPERDPKDLTSSRLQSELYLSAAYQALRLCSFMANPTLQAVQAQILINVYLLNSERAADAWSQLGSLIRQSIAMGLHKDPLSFDPRISMRDAEVRRRVWWSVAGLDALFCVSFGRPSSITFYTTNLPQDRTDDNLSDAPGSAQAILPPSNVLRNETTDMSYHAAYYQLTIPSLELLDRVFRIDWEYSRSAIYGWFSRTPESEAATLREKDEQTMNTYEDAVRLASDIFQWYSHIPRGMRFEPDEDTVESLSRSRTPLRINQTLALCVKTFMLVMVLHRPYLRADPSAYPESSEICFRSAKLILGAYSIGSLTKASIFWSWWTMSFRAFHAGAVCAFLAIRQPNTELATKCHASLRGAIAIFEDRISSWNIAHPVQADLCTGLSKLQQLTVAATRQHRNSPMSSGPAQQSAGGSGPAGSSRSSLHLSPVVDYRAGGMPAMSPDRPTTGVLSQIKGFPAMPMAGSPTNMHSTGYSSGGSGANAADPTRSFASSGASPYAGNLVDPHGMVGDGFNGSEVLLYPQMWASMFGIKLDGELSEDPLMSAGMPGNDQWGNSKGLAFDAGPMLGHSAGGAAGGQP